jgi:peptidoglycan glycosyltransferase
VNRPIRKLAIGCLLMFLALLVNATIVQVVEAQSLRNNPNNSRLLANRLNTERGPIVVGDQAVAASVPTPDQTYKYQRTYPFGTLYPNVTGYFTLYTETGLEQSEDDVLSGTDDRLFLRRLADTLTGRQVRGGRVVLTLNQAAQQAAASGLAGHRGAVVALDPRTGAVLAMATSPSYDPNPLTSHNSTTAQAAYNALATDPAQPLLNRAAQQTYPPGSTFKVVVSATALMSGRYTPVSVIPAPPTYRLPATNTVIHNAGEEICGSGTSDTLTGALTTSCNTAFAGLGVDLGAQALQTQAEAFGMNHTLPGFPLPVAQSVFPTDIDRAQTALSSIGQFDVRWTPLQAAMVAAAIANGGEEMLPYLVQELQGPDLALLSRTQPKVYARPVTSDVAAELTAMMVSVVDNGTGRNAAIPGIKVAGKTGTAENVPGAQTHAWFICFAPADDPKVAVAVVVENGGFGGDVAAPIARNVMLAVLGGQP